MDEITTVGIDLAKEVFAVCILDHRGAVLDRLLHRANVLNIKGRSYRLRDLEQALSSQKA